MKQEYRSLVSKSKQHVFKSGVIGFKACRVCLRNQELLFQSQWVCICGLWFLPQSERVSIREKERAACILDSVLLLRKHEGHVSETRTYLLKVSELVFWVCSQSPRSDNWCRRKRAACLLCPVSLFIKRVGHVSEIRS